MAPAFPLLTQLSRSPTSLSQTQNSRPPAFLPQSQESGPLVLLPQTEGSFSLPYSLRSPAHDPSFLIPFSFSPRAWEIPVSFFLSRQIFSGHSVSSVHPALMATGTVCSVPGAASGGTEGGASLARILEVPLVEDDSMVLLVELGESLHLIGPQRSQSLAVHMRPPLAVATPGVCGGRGSGIRVSLVCWTLSQRLQPL